MDADDLRFLTLRSAELGDEQLERECLLAQEGESHALVYVEYRLRRWDEEVETEAYRARFWG